MTEEQIDELADFAAHMIQPSAYAIPPQPESGLSKPETASSSTRSFPPSIPRTRPPEPAPTPVIQPVPEIEPEDEPEISDTPIVVEGRAARRRARSNANAEATRQVAKVMVGGIRLDGRPVINSGPGEAD